METRNQQYIKKENKRPGTYASLQTPSGNVVLDFSQRDWEQLQYYMQHPEFFEGVVERARAATRHVGTITEDDAICPERRQKVRR